MIRRCVQLHAVPFKLNVNIATKQKLRQFAYGSLLTTGVIYGSHRFISKASCSAAAIAQDPQIKSNIIQQVKNDSTLIKKDTSTSTWYDFINDVVENIARHLRMWYRMAYCTTIITGATWLAPVILLVKDKDTLYEFLVSCIELLGPTFVKLAQWASSRRDLFP
jgi:hypothetical protein